MSVKPDLLFLAHRIPFPPNKGDKIRSFHILKHLSRSYNIYLGCFVDDPEDMRYIEDLLAYCQEVFPVEIKRKAGLKRALGSLLTGESLSMGFYRSADMQRWVDGVIEETGLQRIFMFCSTVGQYLAHHSSRKTVVMDFVDMDSDKWAQYARSKSWPMSKVYERESEKLFFIEQAMAAQATVGLFVSEAEANLFRRLAGSAAHDVRGLANGVDHEFFAPGLVGPAPQVGGDPRLVFVGAMDYWANVDAVDWFARSVLPLVQQSLPKASFTIVGSKPTDAVEKLARRKGVSVTGRVDDVRAYVEAADISVAPLRIARGVQNKVLEAMAMAKPVVATVDAFEGISAIPGEHLMVARSAEQMADAIIALAADADGRRTMGNAARAQVLSAYDWTRNLSELDEIFAAPPSHVPSRVREAAA